MSPKRKKEPEFVISYVKEHPYTKEQIAETLDILVNLLVKSFDQESSIPITQVQQDLPEPIINPQSKKLSDDPELELLSVPEAAKFLRVSQDTLYSYLCNTGSAGGKRKKQFPKDLYIKLGRRTLFVKSKLIEWIRDGAKFE